MLNLLASFFGSRTKDDWVGTGESSQKEVRSVVAADGNRYAQVVAAEKQVNFSDGSIRYLPVADASAQLVVSDAS